MYLDNMFRRMRISHSMFHYKIIRPKRVLEKGGALSHVIPK